MVLQGPRTYTFVKVVTDAGVYGIGEGYGSPGVGIKAGVLELRPYFLGKDPLEIEALYNGLGNRIDGSANMLLRAVSAIEIALWDLAGKLLNQPAATLLGGRYRDRVRVYRDEGPGQHARPHQLQRMGGQDEEPTPPAGPRSGSLPRALSQSSIARATHPTACSHPANCARSGKHSNIAATPSAGIAT